MTGQPRDPQLDALWAQLQTLLPQGPSKQAQAICKKLRTAAEQLEAAGDPDAPEQMSAVLFTEGVLASMGGRDADAEGAYRAALPHAERALAAAPGDAGRRDRLGSLHYNLGNI